MVYVFLANGFEEIEALTVVDLLRRADIQVKTVSVMEDRLVYGSRGVGVEADILYREGDYQRCAMLVLPGGMPGTTNLCNHRELNEELKAFDESGKPIAAICAAPMVLAELEFSAAIALPYTGEWKKNCLVRSRRQKRLSFRETSLRLWDRGRPWTLDRVFIEYLKGQQKAEEIAAELLYE